MSGPPNYAYQAAYRYLRGLVDSAPAGHKLPSLRQLARRLDVSVSTTKYAYALLEDEGRVVARAKFGYFTRGPVSVPLEPGSGALLDRVFSSARQPGMLALSSDAPALLLSLDKPLLALERELLRQYPHAAMPLYQPLGEPPLRAALAERYTRSLANAWQAEDVYVGADLRTVLGLALKALALVGSVAVVESPCSWAVLRQLQAAQIRVIEIPLRACGRVDLARLQRILQDEPVRLAVFSSTWSSPHGSAMPDADKRQIAAWLTQGAIWLFENDSYGELGFSAAGLRFRDCVEPARVLVFGAFDKLIGAEAPYGYALCRGENVALQRVFLEQAARLSPSRQRAIARLFGSPRFEAHLKQLRSLLQARMQRMGELLAQHCARQLRVVAPVGGATFWAEAIAPVEMRQVCERLLTQGIVIAPGELFSAQGQWPRHLRLSYTLDWQQDIGQALECLARAIDAEAQLTP